jgi:hypothetical protein
LLSLPPSPRCSPRSHAGCFEWSPAPIGRPALAGLCTTAARTARHCCPMLASLYKIVTTGSSASTRTGPHNASACSLAFATPRRASRPPRYGCHWCRPVLADLHAPTRDPVAPRGSPSQALQRCVGDPSSSSLILGVGERLESQDSFCIRH